METRFKMKNMILVGMVFIVLSFAYADFGQSAGILDFGNMTIGENKTLSYILINTGDESIDFEIDHSDGVYIEKITGTIDPTSQANITVTAFATEVGEFSGTITATAKSKGSGVVVFNVAVEKNFRYTVIGENNSNDNVEYNENLNLILIIGGLAIFLMFFILYIINLKGGKKRWKLGK